MARKLLLVGLLIICSGHDATAMTGEGFDPAIRAKCMEATDQYMQACFYETPFKVLPGRTTKYRHCIETMVKCSSQACDVYAECMRENYPTFDGPDELFFLQCDGDYWGKGGPGLINPYGQYCDGFRQRTQQ